MARRAAVLKRWAGLIGFGIVCASCSPSSEPVQSEIYREVSVEQARALIREQGAELRVIDVRTPREFEGGHLPGAVNIDVQDGDFRRRVSEHPKDEAVLVYCRSGNRSARAVEIMTELGFQNILEMKAGWRAWPDAQSSD